MARKWTTDEIRAAVGHFYNLTLEKRRSMPVGAEWYDYTFARWRRNGKVQVWVTRPDEVSIPAKHGLATYVRFDQLDIMLVGPEPIARGLRHQVLVGQHRAVRKAVDAQFPERICHATPR